VALAMSAAEALSNEGIAVRVVSMPCVELFDAQDEAYREQVLPASVTARVVIEAGVTGTWWRHAGQAGRVIGLDRFGESAPANELFEHFGFSTDNVVAVAKELL
jgi:transketolase